MYEYKEIIYFLQISFVLFLKRSYISNTVF